MLANDRIVREFSDAVERMDAAELIEYFTADAVYVLVPMPPPLRGRDAIYQSLAGMRTRFRGVRIETVSQVAVGNLVVNERIAHLQLDDQIIALPIAGFFELRDGKIKEWREYFDVGSFKTLQSP